MTLHASIGQLIDRLYEQRAARLECEKQVEAMRADENALKQQIIQQLIDTDLASASGGEATASLQQKTVPVVTDWDQVYGFIHENNMLELLHKRLTATLWEAMRQDGIDVPGTEARTQLDLSLTKSRRK